MNRGDDDSNGDETPESQKLDELMEATYVSKSFLQELNDILLDKKQLIFEGPQGSGKTYVAENFARWFTGQSLDVNTPPNEQVEIVQFHQSYGYEDFV
ncbi:MAG TPA: AAA family ATPase, partial [Thermomicrobiales bacterium]|nr:AAA family ATPase [Thermomicrobiales bacterium]